MKIVLVLLTLMFISVKAYAVCQVTGAKVVQIHQYRDGHIFVDFDKQNDCGCSFGNRMAFHKNDDEKVFVSMILTALTAGNSVKAVSVVEGCPIHGNTAKLTDFHVYK